MKDCLKPVVLWKNDPEHSKTFPCGKCITCKERSQSMWYVRLLCEIPYHNSTSFITLTYDNEYLPKNNSLKHRDFQLFIKRLRKNYSQLGMKYYMCGEYGEHTDRPHFHVILYHNIPYDELEDAIKDCWHMGITNIGTVTPKSIRYCLNYVKKALYENHWVYTSKNRVVPYQRMSQGLGLKYL